jgi:hypothetical protein
MKEIIKITILGYGFYVTYFPYCGKNDGSLNRYGIKANLKLSNPWLSFIFNYRLINLHLRLHPNKYSDN